MSDEHKQELVSDVAMSDKVRDFLDTEVGQYLAAEAERHRESYLLKMADVDPDDAKAVRRLQNQANLPLLFFDWLQSAISKGEAAGYELKQGEDNE